MEVRQEERDPGKIQARVLLWFPWKEGGGRVGGLELASLNNPSGLWGTEVVPGCLVPGPGVSG